MFDHETMRNLILKLIEKSECYAKLNNKIDLTVKWFFCEHRNYHL